MEICTNISFYEFENYTNAWYNEKISKSTNSYIPFTKGYSVMDILDSYFSFIKIITLLMNQSNTKLLFLF